MPVIVVASLVVAPVAGSDDGKLSPVTVHPRANRATTRVALRVALQREDASDRELMRRRRHHSLEDELLDPFAVLDLGDIQVSLGVDVHVMHDIELARRNAVAAK